MSVLFSRISLPLSIELIGPVIAFWCFFICSFFGFILELSFAFFSQAQTLQRQCFFFFPLCPVYGLGALALLCIPPALYDRPILLFLTCFLLSSAVEYFVAFFYEHVLGVSFWDYSNLPFHIHGRVCLPFSLCWGGLGIIFLHFLKKPIFLLLSRIPTPLALPLFLLVSIDAVISLYLLYRHRTPQILWTSFPPRGIIKKSMD